MDQYERELARVLYVDCAQRELVRRYGRTPQEQREFEEQLRRVAVATDFELGDHLPDGTVMVVTRVVPVEMPQVLRVNAEGLREWYAECRWPAIKPHE